MNKDSCPDVCAIEGDAVERKVATFVDSICMERSDRPLFIEAKIIRSPRRMVNVFIVFKNNANFGSSSHKYVDCKLLSLPHPNCSFLGFES